jgi:hypothetical protein
MPYKSKAQQRLFFAKEERGELPKGTAKRWAHETKNIKKLPEKKKGKGKKKEATAGLANEDTIRNRTTKQGLKIGLLAGGAHSLHYLAKHQPGPKQRAQTAVALGKRIGGWTAGSLGVLHGLRIATKGKRDRSRAMIEARQAQKIASVGQALMKIHASLEKTAFGPEQANKVLSIAKTLQLPKASKGLRPGLSAAPNFKNTVKGVARVATPLGATRAEVVEHVAAQPGMAAVKRAGRPVIFPGKGSTQSQFSGNITDTIMRGTGGPSAPAVPSNQRKMLHAVVKGHELDEIASRQALGAGQFGHRSPDVLYREHNRLVTMPAGNEKVKDFMRYQRGAGEAPWLFDRVGLEYGKGPRLSRHARKRLTESAHNLTTKFTNDEAAGAAAARDFNPKYPKMIKRYTGFEPPI